MNKGNFKKWLYLLVTAVLVLSLAACSAKTSNNESAPTDKSGKVKLRIVWWGSQERHDATLKVLKLYEKKNPNVTFESEFSGWDGYWDKLATQSAAKNAPDIIQMDAQFLQEYASRNQLADITKGIQTSDIDPSLLDSGKYKDKLYAIPLGNNAYGMVYNKAALEKLGVTPPKSGWTWDDLFKLAKDVQPKLEKGKYVLRDLTYDAGAYEMYQLSKGKGNLATKDGAFHFDKDTWLEWIKIFADLRKQGVVSPPEVTVSEQEYDPKRDLLLNGSILIKQGLAAQFPSFNSVKPNTFALVAAPRDKESGGYLKPSMFWSVSQNSKYKKEAKKFIDFFINDPEAAEILGVSRGLPVSNSVLEKLKPGFTDSDKAQLNMINETAPDAQPFNGGVKGWGQFNQVEYSSIGEQLIFEKISANDAFEEIQAKFAETVKP
ncbi:sugar ABC transporter substrate-binding protein [Fictibacillus sp. WQ 8-8]|uniref:ABC transporter substrate-binding protein n=1 Tax=Fictibacillus sp. WQ 8-8 TaxID=2938788 RepID=UPI00210D63E9|nr:sugar ABC transporter substrate-binding protein [Fictibacillus sp. WQ 8-8]MCQ6264078.1 sugar ABC transporter substrate-binding protein [Fictibacillus sp. WQ 8-8]